MILLDTCVLLWLVSDQAQISSRARALIERHAGALFISAITGFEIALKHEKGRLRLPLHPKDWIKGAMSNHGIEDARMDWHIAADAANLPPIHSDPCDRIIIATAQALDALLLTPDSHIHAYPNVRVDW